jgi:regulator of nucleoside diphosphate kinase
MSATARRITLVDLNRLSALVDGAAGRHSRDAASAERLHEQLDDAQVISPDDVDGDLVTMGSALEVTDLDTAETFDLTVVFPRQADAQARRISVLAPLGMAVLGLRSGDVVEWEAPSGLRRLRVNEVLSQPEREGSDPG